MAQLFEHDIGEVKVLIVTAQGAVIDIPGGEDQKVTYKKNDPHWTTKPDASGNTARGKHPGKSGEFTLKLLSSNPVNDKLQALVELGDQPAARKANLDVFTITVTDSLSGKPLAFGAKCFILEDPEGEVSIEPDETEWKIYATLYKQTKLGGLAR